MKKEAFAEMQARLVNGFCESALHFDAKVGALCEQFKDSLLRDIMRAVASNREEVSDQDFAALMQQAAARLARVFGGEAQRRYITLWEHLADNIHRYVPAREKFAWFVQATDDGGWVQFDPDLVLKKAA